MKSWKSWFELLKSWIILFRNWKVDLMNQEHNLSNLILRFVTQMKSDCTCVFSKDFHYYSLRNSTSASNSHPLTVYSSCYRAQLKLTLSWRRPLSYRNPSIDLPSKSMGWHLYDNGLRHERVNEKKKSAIRNTIYDHNSVPRQHWKHRIPSMYMFKANTKSTKI